MTGAGHDWMALAAAYRHVISLVLSPFTAARELRERLGSGIIRAKAQNFHSEPDWMGAAPFEGVSVSTTDQWLLPELFNDDCLLVDFENSSAFRRGSFEEGSLCPQSGDQTRDARTIARIKYKLVIDEIIVLSSDVFREWSTPLARNSDTSREVVRPRGPAPDQRARIKADMRSRPRDELRRMKQEEMAATFGGSRQTCVRARNEVLSE